MLSQENKHTFFFPVKLFFNMHTKGIVCHLLFLTGERGKTHFVLYLPRSNTLNLNIKSQMDLVRNNAQPLNQKRDSILSCFTVPATTEGCKTMTTQVS